MKNYCELSSIKLDDIENIKKYMYSVVCLMNRYYTTPISQAIYEMYTSVHYSNISIERLFELINDFMYLTEDETHLSYKKVLFYIQQKISINVKR